MPSTPAALPSRREVFRELPRRTVLRLRTRNLPLHAAGLTFYGALAAVPCLLISIRVAGWIAGESRVRDLGRSLAQAVPSAMGADTTARAVVDYGLAVSWTVVIFSIFPASLYGEGLRRAYLTLGGAPGARRQRWGGWRGRAALLPVLAAAPVLLLVVLGVTPLLADLFARGLGGTVLGVYVALNVDWVVVSIPLAWTFRAVAPQHLSWGHALLGGFATGAFVAGFLQGVLLFVALPVDIGAPFGGSRAVGGVIAALLWLWLLHVVVLVGLAATLVAHGLRRGSPPV